MPTQAHAFLAVAFVEALELVLDVARDRRLVLLELAIVPLIVMELLLSLLRLT